MRLLLLLLSVNCCAYLSFSQSAGETTDVGYIRIQLNDLTSREQEVAVDELIRSKPGVLMSRTDHNTDTYFATYSVDSGITETDFRTWITTVGFETFCAIQGYVTEGVKMTFPKDCLEKEESIDQTTK